MNETAFDVSLLNHIGEAAKERVEKTGRRPDRIIPEGGEDPDYLHRWYLMRHPALGCIYLHRFNRSDDDRALHDHPWPSLSVILEGTYREHMPEESVVRDPGDIVRRNAEDLHRIEVVYGPVWTLFITGAMKREWGFQTPKGWLDHESYFEHFGTQA
jgi:hypothetical protein